MSIVPERLTGDVDPAETSEWIESIEDVLHRHGPERAQFLLERVQEKARREGVLFLSSMCRPPMVQKFSQKSIKT